MKNGKCLLVLLITAIFITLSGCSTTVQMKVTKSPEGRDPQQKRLDDLECSRLSGTHGPCLFGIGLAVNHAVSVKRYTECMNQRGYEVEEVVPPPFERKTD
jgi:hypothetical protein